jgi:hypothetical protein
MTIGRIYGDANRFSISRPGRDVLSVPRTPDYMAVDSSFPRAVRLLHSSIVYGVTSELAQTVLYGVNYPVPPFVEVYAYNGGLQRSEQVLIMGRGAGQPRAFTQPVSINMYTDRFTFRTTDATAEGNYAYQARDWIYFVYPP